MKTEDKEREIFIKLCRYCAYRERSIFELKNKMLSLDIPLSKHNKFIKILEEENFLNEARYAKSFALGKFRNNSWGRIKINHALKESKLSAELINNALNEIPEEEYEQKISSLISKKQQKYKVKNVFQTRQKIAYYLQTKGFEANLIWEILKQDIPD
ncbi:MAG: RecX family transcriptional regulator [Bacteroidetes bacterium]|nr:RecX family transcriptional regulator [Bacteroidota bacterium]